jgi:predicted nucleic acid-binding protein
MSVEPGILDANILVYAFDTDAPQHVASRRLLDAGRTGATTLYVTSQILCEFYSIVTNARRVAKPRRAAEAIAAIGGLLSFLHVLPIPMVDRHPQTSSAANGEMLSGFESGCCASLAVVPQESSR